LRTWFRAPALPGYRQRAVLLRLRFLRALANTDGMRRSLAVLSCAFFLFTAGCASHNQARTQKRAHEEAARSAASRWLALLDQGDYEQAFEWEAQDFRMARTQSQFVRYMQARRAPFGHSLDRKVIGSANIRKFVGVPEGNYVSVLFKTNFERKSETAERVIMVEQEVGWRVLEYRIY
jgi:uncharacterized protein DUF4019